MTNNNEYEYDNYETNYYIDNTNMDFSHMDTDNTSQQEPESKMGLAIASMVIGILSLTLCCIFGSLLGIIGFIFGIIALVKRQKGAGMAIAGIATSILGFLVGVLILVYVFAVAIATGAILNSYEGIINNPEFRYYMDSEDFNIEEFDFDDWNFKF